MTCVDLGDFADTVVLPLQAMPTSWTNPGPQTAVVIYATVDACLRLQADATPGDFLLLAGAYARVRLDSGARLSVVAAAGATGEARVTLAGES